MATSSLRRVARLVYRIIVGGMVLLALSPLAALAHPMGNFTINRYSHLQLHSDELFLFYIVDFAEIPALAELLQMDADGDKEISEAEEYTYLDGAMRDLLTSLTLTINGEPQPLTPITARMTMPPGEQEMPTLRLEFDLSAALPPATDGWQLHYRDNNRVTRNGGWQEIIATPAEGITLLDATVPTTDVSDELRNYPNDLLTTPIQVREAHVRFALTTASGQPNAGAVANAAATVRATPVADTQPLREDSDDRGETAADGIFALLASTENDRFAQLMTAPLDGPGAILLLLLAAFGWGGLHALSPGHGKTVVAAYLVGSRGTVGHALFLGLTTTLTHTVGVFALGFVTLFISAYILPEELYPWLSLFSGLLVAVVGFSLLRSRWQEWRHAQAHAHGHDHHHHHDHHDDQEHGEHGHSHLPPEQITWRSLLALGISGGLLPCPSALVVMLGAIAFNRIAFGLLLILIFSLGLATVLTVTGLLFVYAGRLFARLPVQQPLFQLLPVLSALLVTLLGIGITWQALVTTGFFVS